MTSTDVRWIQRFSNYRKALYKLTQAVEIVNEQVELDEKVDDLLKEGLIQRFEYTHELAWKVMKDYAEYQGYTDIRGSRDAIRKAFEMGLIDDKRWMNSIEDRNLTSHNYDDEVADEIFNQIVKVYSPLFELLEEKLLPLSGLEPALFD
jgi:nucleotidyltransferase substrate binding protein (TIGR01987 family)